ncbi:MAG: DUF192 domain-containing protein [Treponema sp.]|jgi:uncharacterized membrane protein (UPF0127 family)|nr:DUF192 domain-containing protein [Treponema sp.]
MNFRTQCCFVIPVLAVFVLGASLSCTAEERKSDTGKLPRGSEIFEKKELTIMKAGGDSLKIRAEIAKTKEQQEQGLMYRESLADGEGMLFVYTKDQIMRFWMKNTLIDLSIAFIASGGNILEIRDLQKGDLSTVTSTRSARYALEVPRGWFTRESIRPGDRLVIGEW